MASDEEALNSISDKTSSSDTLADQIVERCVRIVAQVNRFKQPRLDRIQLYRDLYAGKVRKKYRQPFNVVLPVFSGILDTLMAGFNDDLALEFKEQEPADYLPVRKLNTLWGMETGSVAPNAKFALKARQDRSNALFSGRGFMMNYAESDPDYHNVFEVFELEDAIFQPRGGGHWPTHLYAGRQNIIRSESDLKSSVYDQAQVKKLLDLTAKTDFYPSDDNDTKAALIKYKAMGLNTTDADYVGERLFRLVEMRVTVNGTAYYIVFSPWYKIWVRFDKLSNIFSAGLDPWVSYATHEDNKNFLNKSYADDMYGVADAVHTLFNQELTNRERTNFHPRAYDIAMFPDVAKLDAAQTRPDALVPVTVPAGKRIQDGIFTFDTGGISGTINLIEWINQTAGREVGVTDLSMGGAQGITKRASVVIAEQQAIAKRMLLRSSSYTEAMAEIGKLFIQGCKDHLPAKKAIRLLGADGEGWDEIKRADLDLYSDVDVKIVSSSIEMQNTQLKKEARMKVLAAIGADPILAPQVNPQWRIEELLRSGGEFSDIEIKEALDTKNYGNKEEQARAYQAIQAVLNGEPLEKFYGATTYFMQIIVDYASDNRTSMGAQKYNTMMAYVSAHADIAKQNMIRKAKEVAAAAPAPQPEQPGQPTQPPANTPSIVPQQTDVMRQAAKV